MSICASSPPRDGDSRHRIRRRDEEGRVHAHELSTCPSRASSRCTVRRRRTKPRARSSLLFGLSGTGKTTLSADPKRNLIGDDEHCWSDDGIFNIEGGCYAKAIYLSKEAEPDIFQALRFGSVLENVVYDDASHHVDFDDASITQNTRGAYPIEFMPSVKLPCVAGHPRDVIFLTCDAFGVLPPVSKLTPQQAMFHFVNGYTAKVAGTEVGVTEPEATFSPASAGRSWCGIRTNTRSARRETSEAQRPGLAGKYRLDGAARRASARGSSCRTPEPLSTRFTPARCARRRPPSTACSTAK